MTATLFAAESAEITTETTERTYTVPEYNFAKLADGIERLNRRARRLKLEEITITRTLDSIREEYRSQGKDSAYFLAPGAEPVRGTYPTGTKLAFWKVIVSGSYPKLPGWTFLATLTPIVDEAGQTTNLLKTVPGEHCPAHLAHRAGDCDHCRTRRNRNETYVVKHEDTGAIKVIGRNCLKDFLGGKSPEQLATAAEFLITVGELCSACEDCDGDDWDRPRDRAAYGAEIGQLLEYTGAVIELCGWIPRSKADEMNRNPTAADVSLALFPSPRDSEETNRIRQEIVSKLATYADEAQSALDWARELTDETTNASNYLANLRTVARAGWIDTKHFGIACSILPAYRRAQSEARDRANRKESAYFGEVKKRYTLTLTVEKVIAKESFYGLTGIHLMTDADGNRFTWYASGSATWLRENDTVTVKATVKDHEEYRGQKTTVLSRVAEQ